MMNGHKWECFIMELTMLPWHLLSIATVGLSDLFFGCAYRTAVRTEFFAHVRAQVKAEGGAQALRDTICTSMRAKRCFATPTTT